MRRALPLAALLLAAGCSSKASPSATTTGAATGTGSGGSGGAGGHGGEGGAGGGAVPAMPAIRVNLAGYEPGSPVHALLMAPIAATKGTFKVVDGTGKTAFQGPLGASLGAWSPAYPYVYDLAAPASVTAGTFEVSGPVKATSKPFSTATADLYTQLFFNAVSFYTAQRDGLDVSEQVLSRMPSHLADQMATVYAPPAYTPGPNGSFFLTPSDLTPVAGAPVLDVSGGWFDGGDYLKLVETASYAELAMLIALRDNPALPAAAATSLQEEQQIGLGWLEKMWNDGTQTLYYQVGLGDGNASLDGDHDLWRLPEADDQRTVTKGDRDYFIRYRPVYPAGAAAAPVSPNLAGRLAASYALCAQVYQSQEIAVASSCLTAAEHVFDLADTTATSLVTSTPDYYPEVEWRDDLELGAVEIADALTVAGANLPPGLAHTNPTYYLTQAAHWANAYIHGPNDGADSLGLFDVSGLAHHELFKALAQPGAPAGLEVTPAALLADLKLQLDHGQAVAAKDPFGLAYPYSGGRDVTPHALGIALLAGFYDDLTQSTTYAELARAQLDWVFGRNPWGLSFVVGAGSSFPDCLHHQVANLVGALNGSSPILAGAVVDGPSALASFMGLGVLAGQRPCPASGMDALLPFSGSGARTLDGVIAVPSTTPTLDHAALTILLLAPLTQGK